MKNYLLETARCKMEDSLARTGGICDAKIISLRTDCATGPFFLSFFCWSDLFDAFMYVRRLSRLRINRV